MAATLTHFLLEDVGDTPLGIVGRVESILSDAIVNAEYIRLHLSTISSEWFDKFVREAFGDHLVQPIKRAASYLSGAVSLNGMVDYARQQGQRDRWSLRSLLHAIHAEQTQLSQFDDLWKQLSAAIDTPKIPVDNAGEKEYIGILHSLLDAATNRQLTLSEVHEMVSNSPEARHTDRIPKSIDTEILYHASISARPSYHQGFLTGSDPVGFSSLYGSRPAIGLIDPNISFTSDLAIAHEIMRSLKEMVQIAQREITMEDIREWASNDEVRLDDPGHLTDSIPDTYRLYLDYLEKSERYNPVYLGDINLLLRHMVDARIDDVGILECSVRIDDDIEYLRSLREFKIPADAIISINRLIL